MPINLPQSYDKEFCQIWNNLKQSLPEELFRLEGVHDDQLDINKTSRAFFKNSNGVIADHSIDANANVTGKDVITFNYEVPKALMKLNSLHNLWKTMKETEQDDYHLPNVMLSSELAGSIYINDSWDIGRPYCFNFSTYDIALEGLKMGSRLNIVQPKSLFTFLRQLEQFVVYAGNSNLGATGLADMLIVASWYVDRILKSSIEEQLPYKDHHTTVGTSETNVWTYVKEALTSFIYTVNWEFRGNQSPFTNVSIYDDPFLEQLVPHYVINGMAPRMDTVRKVQSVFLEAYNSVLKCNPITFPVVTACLSLKQGSDKRELADTEFAKKICQANLKFGFINFYIGETSTLSSCCRLRSDASNLGYANTFGAGSTKIGSLGVVTVNLPQIAQLAVWRFPEGDDRALTQFLDDLKAFVRLAGAVNNAKRVFIKDRIHRGSLPLYTLGFMDLKRQYSTCGFTGLYEAVQILGYDMADEEGVGLAQTILEEINAQNKWCTEKYGTPHNMEQVPGESSSVKLAQKDAVLNRNAEGYKLYSNQFVPLWAEGFDLLDRIRIQGKLDKYCTGGAICHLNVATRIEKVETMMSLVQHSVESGVVYFAINYAINQCMKHHMTVGHNLTDCPICGAPISDTYTRVVGFLTNTKYWNQTRREEDWPNRQFTKAESHA